MRDTYYMNQVRNYFRAYETKDKNIVEQLLSNDFTFSSPYDDKINRETYFLKCWPSSEWIENYHIQNLLVNGAEVFIRYECRTKSGANIRNMELFRFNGDKIQEIDVYFGFDEKAGLLAEAQAKKLSTAFAKGDAQFVINNLCEDVRWEMAGDAVLNGKAEVSKMFEQMEGVAAEEYKINKIISNRNRSAVAGEMKIGDERYAYCDIYTFDPSNDYKIKEMNAFLIKLED